MGLTTIQDKIKGITDGGLNTAAEMRDVLTDMTETLSGSTGIISGDTDNLIEGSSNLYYTNERVGSYMSGHTGDTSVHFTEASISITESQISDLQDYSLSSHTHNLDDITTVGNSTPNSIEVSGITTPFIEFEISPILASPISEGEMRWNADDGTLNIGLAGDTVVLQVGQEMVIYAKADENITNGDIVYATGAVGASGKMSISKFIGDGSLNDVRLLGVATEDISSEGFGYVTSFGVVRGIDTTGQNGETWNEGEILYASPTISGSFTNIEPIAPNHTIETALLLTKHVNNGVIFVRPTVGEHLGSLHDIILSGLTNGDVITYDSSAQVWKNQPILITESQISDIQSYSLTGHSHNLSELNNDAGFITSGGDVFLANSQTFTGSNNFSGQTTFLDTVFVGGGNDINLANTGKIINLLDGVNPQDAVTMNQFNNKYPASGTTGQVLGKISDVDQTVGWIDVNSGAFEYNGTSILPLSGTNTSIGTYSTVGGGQGNVVTANHTFIGGGNNNIISGGTYSSILGGQDNTVSHNNSHIIGSNLTSTQIDTTYVENLIVSGDTTANSFIKVGGTSSQFLKADGSVTTGTKTSYGYVLSASDGVPVNGNNVENDRMPYAFTCKDVRIHLLSGDTTTKVSVDVLKNGVSIFDTEVTIDVATKTSVGATNPFVFTASATEISFVDNDEVSFNVSAVTDAVGLKVYLIGEI